MYAVVKSIHAPNVSYEAPCARGTLLRGCAQRRSLPSRGRVERRATSTPRARCTRRPPRHTTRAYPRATFKLDRGIPRGGRKNIRHFERNRGGKLDGVGKRADVLARCSPYRSAFEITFAPDEMRPEMHHTRVISRIFGRPPRIVYINVRESSRPRSVDSSFRYLKMKISFL